MIFTVIGFGALPCNNYKLIGNTGTSIFKFFKNILNYC